MADSSVQQHALTVIAGIEGSRDELARRLDAVQEPVLAALGRVTTLHYGRFAAFTPSGGGSAIAFETNYDGDENAHLLELQAQLGPHLDGIFGLCDGYTTGDFVAFARAHSRAPAMYYRSHAGLTVQQIRHDARVRAAIETWLDEADANGQLCAMRASAIVCGLQTRLAQLGLQVGPVARGLPRQPWAGLLFLVMLLFYLPVEAVLAAIAAVVFEPADRRDAQRHPPALLSDHDPAVNALIDAEELHLQNGLTHIVALKPGCFRRSALRLALSAVEQAHRLLYFEGTLGGIASIHFARWVLMDDGTVVFLSSYDGTWDSYLGDFVDKSHWFLTAIWTNTRWFPETHGLLLKGATAERAFKQWARTFQVKNQIWYSAYPELSVRNILDNATIRELAGGELLHSDEVSRWLALL